MPFHPYHILTSNSQHITLTGGIDCPGPQPFWHTMLKAPSGYCPHPSTTHNTTKRDTQPTCTTLIPLAHSTPGLYGHSSTHSTVQLHHTLYLSTFYCSTCPAANTNSHAPTARRQETQAGTKLSFQRWAQAPVVLPVTDSCHSHNVPITTWMHMPLIYAHNTLHCMWPYTKITIWSLSKTPQSPPVKIHASTDNAHERELGH